MSDIDIVLIYEVVKNYYAKKVMSVHLKKYRKKWHTNVAN